jgi:FAD/FMN-containing dehydrogenase
MIGPMLGGGHSLLQGYYGTLADNLVEAKVVLADGDAVIVSANSNTDLFWALRGAGHNFGIISEYKYKVYNHSAANKWAFIEFIFAGPQLEDLYHLINELSDDGKRMHPVRLIYLASYLHVPEIDSKNVRYILPFPSIQWTMSQ